MSKSHHSHLLKIYFDYDTWCVPEHRAERKQASGLSSGLCASAAPDASAAPSPAPGDAEWPVAFAPPGTPKKHDTRQILSLMPQARLCIMCQYRHSHWRAAFHYLFLLPHDLQFLCQLDLPLPLCFLCSTAQLLSVFITKSVQGCSSISHLSQLILQPLIVHCQKRDSSDTRHTIRQTHTHFHTESTHISSHLAG